MIEQTPRVVGTEPTTGLIQISDAEISDGSMS
jgi:hypothetical protein